MAVDPQDTGALIVREYKGTPFYEAKWRDSTGAQRKRRLGRAWLEREPGGSWVRRRGRIRPGHLDERRAYREMATIVEEHEDELRRTSPEQREATFADAATAWLEYVEHERRIKPSTLARYRSLLRAPGGIRKPRTPRLGRPPLLTPSRIMSEFGEDRLADITSSKVRRFLAMLDREELSARTVNVYRQVLHSIFAYATRGETFGLRDNPVAATTKRPEEGARPIETFEPHEVRAIAAAAQSGLHRRRPDHDFSAETNREWDRVNEQDGALFIFAACTGLRLGELCALRWSDIDLDGGFVIVSRAMSAGQELSTKSRRARTVPLADQARAELKRLQARGRFTTRTDHVFCRPDGGPLDRTAVRKRFICAQEKAGVRVRRFHDLRHTFGSLAIRRFDLVAVKDMMGHAKLTTTERYLHSKPRPDDAAKLTRIFE